MSAKMIAASRSNARIGCSVISQASSGVRIASSMDWFARTARYSGI